MNKPSFKILIGFFLLSLALYLAVVSTPYLSLDYLKASQQELKQFREAHPGQVELIYFLVYVVSAAVSVPGAGILTLAGGALFGVAFGTVLVSFASTIGATLSFLLTRYLLKDWARARFQSSFRRIDQGFESERRMYLFSLRLIPAFPFFAVNSMMALTRIKASEFYWISQIGMLPGTIAYVWAGQEVAGITSLSGILSPSLLAAFTALGLLPWVVRLALASWQKRKIYSRFHRPQKYDYNLVVIGAGAAGLVSTAIARAVKAKVAIIEKHKMGGDCLNYGCVPSKALIHFANHHPRRPYSEIHGSIHEVVHKIEPHDSVDRFSKLGAQVIKGTAEILSPWEVQVGDQVLTTRNIIIATGAEPFIPNIPGRDKIQFMTSETFWDEKSLPSRLLIVGGGPIGCELAQAMARLGVKVTLIERGPRLLAGEVESAGVIIHKALKHDQVQVHLNSELQEFTSANSAKVLASQNELLLEFDRVLFAIGRKPRVEGFGLEKLGVQLDAHGRVARNSYMQTNFPNIYVCGDVTSTIQLTHVAGHQAWYASVNALFGRFKMFAEDLRVIPKCTFTSPQVASVGIHQEQAKRQSLDYDVTRFEMDDFDRAICDQAPHGFIEIVTAKNSDQILGVTIVAQSAGELIAEYALAMRWKLGLKKILATVHAYPTWSDANKLAALEWQRKNAPKGLLRWIERYHDWQRRE